MGVTGRYRDAWEGFWRDAPGRQGAVFWDAEPVLTAGVHLAHFEPLMLDPGLPIVDLGCGNGTQSRFLAAHFTRVVGADLSAAALDKARDADPDGQVTYRLLDASEKGEPETLHAELGDANVYMRGVLHQAAPEDRQQLVDSIAALLGDRGRAFLVELSEAAKPILVGLAQSPEGPPAKLAPIFQHGIAPGEVADEAVPVYLSAAGLTIVAHGELPLITTEYRGDGTRIELPSKWWVVGRSV